MYRDLGAWGQAVEYSRQAIDVADAISNAQTQSAARLGLARISCSQATCRPRSRPPCAGRDHDYPADRAELSLLLGIVQLRQDQPAEAAREFRGAITQADELLQQASGAYAALDTKALALCGLALTTEPGQAAEAAAVFRAARAITSADGIVRRTLALFDALAAADRGGILAGIRPDAEGRRTRTAQAAGRASGSRTTARRPGAGVAEGYRAAVGFGGGPHDGQAQARHLRSLGPAARVVQAGETTEGPFGIFGRDTRPVVGHGEHGPPAVRPHRHAHLAGRVP